MEYLLLIYNREAEWDAMPEGERAAYMEEFHGFTGDIRRSGHYRASNPLHPTTAATTVRVRDGRALTTDGPFAETREQLGGYYLVEAQDLDEAIGIAARIPSARAGSVEVRPVLQLPPR